MNHLISSKQLNLGYGNQIVITNLNLEIDIAKNYFVIGKNGAGKSTLLNFLSNNFEGNIFNSNFELNSKVSILETGVEQNLINELTLKENFEFFTNGIFNLNIHNNIVEKYKLNHFLNDRYSIFSSGMKKRSELVLIEINEPDFLCIDEPLNFLDTEGVKLLKELLIKRTNNKKGNLIASQQLLDIFNDDFKVINLDEIQ
ncbi:MAG: ATP-binding cassette domain-containing protein [Actinomycetota bacterium]|nr:ATP-binding cassette domain-containing protein [Actinomycetota bacterium]MDA3012928.1 ATP-binding cassette domain-containing protein [Actinomycetota bacterium]